MPRVVDLDERRAALAGAAARVIARSGLGAATMREVAAEAGWTTGALTHYFDDKRELLRFTLEASLESRRADAAARHADTPDATLRSALVRALPIDDDARLHWIVTIAFLAEAGADDELARIQRDHYRHFRDGVARLVDRAGRGRDTSARREAERLIAVLDGIAIQALFDPESWPPARQLAALDAALDAR